MDETTSAEELVRIGLTSYEARAYVALVGRASSTAAELARLAGVPRQRIYDVLGSVVEKGLASTRPGGTLKYVATEPRRAIDALVAAQRQRLVEVEERAETVIDRLTPAYRAGQQRTAPLDYIEVLRDRGTIAARFEQLQASVTREILVFNKPPYAIGAQDNVQGLSVARAHEARGLYEASLFADLAATEGVRRFVRAGEQARVVSDLPLKLVIIDERVVMFGMQDPLPERVDLTIMVVEHPALAGVLKMAFNAYWERGMPFEQAYEQFAQTRLDAV